jgi:hypothetical protein
VVLNFDVEAEHVAREQLVLPVGIAVDAPLVLAAVDELLRRRRSLV